MKIIGIDGMSVTDLQDEVNKGGRFVIYKYCISVIVLSFRRPSDIYFLKHDQNKIVKGLSFTLISVLLGWWGIPWGIIYTIGAIGTNFGGGKNVTDEVMRSIHSQTNGPVFDFEKHVTAKEENELKELV
jgi:hypothetical protein